jgi:hypothetical protein
MYASVIPDPVFAMFWIQAVIGSCLPLRSKAFLAGQFVVFAFLFFVFCEVEDKAKGAVISHGVLVLAGGKGLVLLAFWVQSIGLLFVPNRIKYFVSAEILLALSLSQLAYWLPTGWYSPHSPMSNGLWVAFLTQCTLLSWWLFFRPSGHFVRHA